MPTIYNFIGLNNLKLLKAVLITIFLVYITPSNKLWSKTDKLPNVIIIIVDDMGYGGVSCFDNNNFKTPEIDKLAEEGMKLTSFYSNGALCSPTRAAMMTGKYQQRLGCDRVIGSNTDSSHHLRGLAADEWTFAEAMKTKGYSTALFGKWHLGFKREFNPLNHGFDEFTGFISGQIDAHSHYNKQIEHDWWKGFERNVEAGYHTDLITKHALDFIERESNNPFFLIVSHGAPHKPNQARGSEIVRGPEAGTYPPWSTGEEYNSNRGDKDWLIRHFILPVDEGVGKIQKKLKELNILDETMIWFISDNGASSSSGTESKLTRDNKGSFFEGGIRVPGIVKYPKLIAPHSVSDELMLTFDIMPTVLNLCRIEKPDSVNFDGIDITPALFNNQKLKHKIRFWEQSGRGALRDGEWKLVIHKSKEEFLYNIKLDPQEKNNLALNFPERLKSMKTIFDSMRNETKADSPY